ncbi:MAG: UTP--glucose-1-phosphate uridylyltransferase [bacterium]|nr:UTP--glucose-1-phosphate uridylyltransferase [bacterium]
MLHIDRDEIRNKLKVQGIDPDHIKSLHVKLQSGELDHSSFVIDKNRLRPPTNSDINEYSNLDTQKMINAGNDALKDDELLVFWLNGGAATRYFDESKVTPEEQIRYQTALNKITPEITNLPKGVAPVIDDMSYLELKIRNLLEITKQSKLDVHPQVVIMNSFITDEQTRKHLNALYKKYPDLDPERFHFVVQQPTMPRFTKVDNLKNIDLFVTTDGSLSFAPCGHGDFIYLLQDYLRSAHIPNVKYLFFANIDNLGATIDPALLGYHVNHKYGRTVELATKELGDQGGAPCFVDEELIIVEQMKFPPNFDQDSIKWFNTNSFWFTLKDLMNFDDDLPLILAEKTIDKDNVFQLEHFACDVHLPSKYINIPRQTRFWPVKRYVDLLIYQDPSFNQEISSQFSNLLQSVYNIT